jgi:diacylglycerol kinase (ATP)
MPNGVSTNALASFCIVLAQQHRMKHITLVHNPSAGDETHDKKTLQKLIEANDFEHRYLNTKKSQWHKIRPDTDLLLIAGGDGTVRKTIRKLLDKNPSDASRPIALLPMGTANNIAKTLGFDGTNEQIISSLRDGAVLQKFDVGRIRGAGKAEFFLESFGFGVFPYLMKKMEKYDDALDDDPEAALKKALQVLVECAETYKAKDCRLTIDGEDRSGRYLLVEAMNIKSIGPNLFLAPDADTADGAFNVVLVPEADRGKLVEYVKKKLEGRETDFGFRSVQGKRVSVSWQGTHAHADDELLKLKAGAEVNLEIKPSFLEFLLPKRLATPQRNSV